MYFQIDIVALKFVNKMFRPFWSHHHSEKKKLSKLDDTAAIISSYLAGMKNSVYPPITCLTFDVKGNISLNTMDALIYLPTCVEFAYKEHNIRAGKAKT